MQIPNPNNELPYDRVIKDNNDSPIYGIRNEHKPSEEIVNLQTGESNTKYWQPEMVLNPEGCEHDFHLYDLGKREIECDKCHFCTNFIVGVNFKETDHGCFILFKKKEYLVSL